MLYLVQYSKENISKTNIFNHWKNIYRAQVQKILNRHKKFFRNELKKFNDDIEMFILFIDEIDVIDLKQTLYSLIAKDRKAMNEILDSLLNQNRLQKMSLNKIFVAASSIFVIWKNDKLKIIVDLKKINTRLYSNIYSLSRQDTILKDFDNVMIFSSIDLIKSFFQQETKSKDWWKITLITSHRDQKWFTMFIMRLTNISDFFQHRMKQLLDSYLWQFVVVYIDDVIIYSQSLIQYIQHLDQILTLLKNSDVTLTLSKCHFVYSSIVVLDHHVSRLKLNIVEKKIEIIRKMFFSRNLKELEIRLRFFDYYRFFMNHYAIIARFLVRLKIKSFANDFVKNRSRRDHVNRVKLREDEESASIETKAKRDIKINFKLDVIEKCRQTWKKLKTTLCIALILIYFDFFKSFILYVDDNKKKEFETAVHQVNKEDVKRSILFLSRDLSDAKTRYWAIELKIDALIWALIKLSQYFDDEIFIVITNHTTLKSTLQNKSFDRRSTRLNEWIMYLSIYLSRMKIVHRAKKNHNNVDELSRLLIIYVHAHAYLVTTIETSEKFLDKLKKSLKSNSIFKRIYEKLQQQTQNTMNDVNDSITMYQSYRFDIDNDLLYLVNRFNFDRVCISVVLKRDVMKFVHDNHAHEDIHRILNRIKTSTYFSKMRKKMLIYVESCFVCQLFKFSRKFLYEQLNLIEITIQILTKLNMNFIIELFMILTKHNFLLTIIDRFSKYVRLIVDRENWSIK